LFFPILRSRRVARSRYQQTKSCAAYATVKSYKLQGLRFCNEKGIETAQAKARTDTTKSGAKLCIVVQHYDEPTQEFLCDLLMARK
jgi:hypothetical protein